MRSDQAIRATIAMKVTPTKKFSIAIYCVSVYRTFIK